MPDNYDTNIPAPMSDREQEIVDESLREFSQMQLMRNTTASHWEEIAELIDPPSRNTFMYGNFNWPGEKKTERQVDASGMMAWQRFKAIMDSLLTPRNQQWHALMSSDPTLNKNRQAREWYEEATRRLFITRYAPIGNFSAQNQNYLGNIGAYGTAGMFVDQAVNANNKPIRALRYKAIPIGELFLRENHQGLVDGFVRWFRLTPYQAYQKWGDKCPPQVKAAMARGSMLPMNFLHRVCPRSDYDPGNFTYKGMEFASYYISLEGRTLLQEGGYRTFPLAASRYEQTPGEVYGRSPAMMVLPALKTLNAEKKVFLKQGHRAADPIYLTADDGLVDFNATPGFINKGGMNSDGKPLVGIVPTGSIQVTEEMMKVEVGLINDAFLVSLFQILEESPQMTATEVIERVNEKGILMAPTVGRQQSEYLGPLIDRELNLMSELGMLPPMPPALREAQGDYSVNYTSPLSRAARAQEAAGFMRTVENVKELVAITQDTSLLDPFDFDTAIPAIADIQAVPITWMATEDAIAQKRQARAKQQQLQAQIQAMPAQAAMMKAQAQAQQQGGAPPEAPQQAGG